MIADQKYDLNLKVRLSADSALISRKSAATFFVFSVRFRVPW
jgi:hypothetical protein